MSYLHVLVEYDGTAEADEALSAAALIADLDGARITVAAVVEREPPSLRCGISTRAWNELLVEQACADLQKAAGRLTPRPELTVLFGGHAQALASGAHDLGCDAIMLPGRPRRGLARLLWRDRAPRLRRRAACPVLQPS